MARKRWRLQWHPLRCWSDTWWLARINDIITKTDESKKSLEIFTKSYKTLANSEISREEEKEYRSYVENAKDAYYENKEIEYILTTYKLLIGKESDYNNLIVKRDKINNILSERIKHKKWRHTWKYLWIIR